MQVIIFYIISFLINSIITLGINDQVKTKSSDSSGKKILLELFTSQGCSSCPPADKLLGELIKQDTNLIALSFHVDYWNRLGWKDPFSNAAYSNRQYYYANLMKLSSVYTPQLIIQGKYEMTGSYKLKIEETINTEENKKQNYYPVSISVQNISNKISVSYKMLSPVTQGNKLFAALIYDKTITPVANGENAGATLTDYNVVQQLQSSNTASGSIYFNKINENSVAHYSVIIFLQNEKTADILYVNQVKLK